MLVLRVLGLIGTLYIAHGLHIGQVIKWQALVSLTNLLLSPTKKNQTSYQKPSQNQSFFQAGHFRSMSCLIPWLVGLFNEQIKINSIIFSPLSVCFTFFFDLIFFIDLEIARS